MESPVNKLVINDLFVLRQYDWRFAFVWLEWKLSLESLGVESSYIKWTP